MIQPNAKCVVNGKKVNEIALWLNQFIALKNKELDVVDANNTPSKRWFLNGGVPGGVGAAESGDRDNLGGTSGGAAGTGGGASGNRDQLTIETAQGRALIKQYLDEGIALGRSGDRSSFEAWVDKYNTMPIGGSEEELAKEFAEEISLLRKLYNR